ncbi:MAG: alpha/beta hydrolase fold domain-containing protein [Verrucomicrobiota bacterium]
MAKSLSATLITILMTTIGLSSESNYSVSVVPYKTLHEQDPLVLKIYTPAGASDSNPLPGIVFFFGGGWNGGNISHLEPQAIHLAERGMISICAQYRTKSSHEVTPNICLEDAWDATRYINEYADEYFIDPKRIAAGGGSAGGHLAAATAFCPIPEGIPQDYRPDVLVLFNPVIDNGPNGYGYDRVSEYWKQFSPLHNIRSYRPPSLFLIGDSDDLIPVATAEAFAAKLNKGAPKTCRLIVYKSAAHGFFNKGRVSSNGKEYFAECIEAMDTFLVDQGYLASK